jgi:hypothetical protein
MCEGEPRFPARVWEALSFLGGRGLGDGEAIED